MKKLYTLFLLLFFSFTINAQQITLSGGGIDGTATLDKASDEINGKPYYTGTGSVLGNAGVAIAIYWAVSPSNVWVLTYSGQPYFSSATPSSLPPGTEYKTWTLVPGNPSVGTTPLSITGDVTLKVSLYNFTAKPAGETIKLHWQTSAEINNKGFMVQRSTDRTSWTNLKFVDGAGTTSISQSYHFTDALPPLANTIYYRLQQSNFDQTLSYSKIINVRRSSSSQYQVLNNPSNGHFIIKLPNKISANSQIIIYNILGMEIYREGAHPGINKLNITSAAAGTYFLKITDGSQIFSTKLIKL